MLFLKKDEIFGHYYGAIEPFSIAFNENNLAELQTNIDTIDEDSLTTETKVGSRTFIVKNEIHEAISDTISGKKLEEIIEQVKNQD